MTHTKFGAIRALRVKVITFCFLRQVRQVRRLATPPERAQKLTILITFDPPSLNCILTKFEANRSKSLGGVR